ncbi:hypothetical protein D2E25_0476 [Bifidobacterium goeldii]|uniref:DUF4192 family protein n=1 Tax=Bifidobacterium goeldii TaxID=2306975 RepID=A0A430FMW5_9BIFI|nr:DUF4192 family protein [Bifidobacterium goeldii]RSX54168.1 hypothetical protein D2E25_0476 [Bifidobacterium goeldii]
MVLKQSASAVHELHVPSEQYSAVERLSSQRLTQLTSQYRQDRRCRGASIATHDWVRSPFAWWADALEHGESQLDVEAVAALAVGMNEVLSIRDALVLSLIAVPTYADVEVMIELAARPHDPAVQRRMYRELNRAFADDQRRPDIRRCLTGVDLLTSMIGALPERFGIQPLAIIAYALWWIGDRRAVTFALQCLMLDDECTLAAIVCSAIQRGTGPAWRDGQPLGSSLR